MTKCDFCRYSKINMFGRAVCPFLRCNLSEKEHREILIALAKRKGE